MKLFNKVVAGIMTIVTVCTLSVVSFAAPLVNDANYYTFKATINGTPKAGETFTVGFSINTSDSKSITLDGVSLGGAAARFTAGLHYDSSIVTLDNTKTTLYSGITEDPQTKLGDTIAGQEFTFTNQTVELPSGTPFVTYTFTVNAGVAAGTYADAITVNAEQCTLMDDTSMMSFGTVMGLAAADDLVVAGDAPAGATATAAGTSADGKITAYTIANDAAGDVDATEKVITKTFEGLTITDATRVYVTIDGENRVFGSDLAEATNGLEIGKLTFGIIVKANVDLSKITEFDVR